MSSRITNPISAQAPMSVTAYAVAPTANSGPDIRHGSMYAPSSRRWPSFEYRFNTCVLNTDKLISMH